MSAHAGFRENSTCTKKSAAEPMIMVGPDVATGLCETPVRLLDLSATIADHFDAAQDVAEGIAPLPKIAAASPDPERIVFSDYYATGAVSGAFMLRKGRWKLIHHVGYDDEIVDLEADP